MGTNVGILGIGVYLPPDVRTNDWWSADVVAQWVERARQAGPVPVGALSESGRLVMDAMARQLPDPFQGAVERHVMSAAMSSTDMEVEASNDALKRATVAAGEIDLVLTHTVAPDYWLTNSAAKLHGRLNLKHECFAMQVEAAAYAFLGQLAIAEAMIVAGRARVALLVQSSACSRLVEPHDAVAPYFGDGATAVVVGPVHGRGIRASAHFTDGRFPNSIVAGVPGGTWYDPGRAVIHIADAEQLRAVLVQTLDLCKLSVDTVLARAELDASQIDFFCIHQGTAWLRSLAQEHAGLRSARTIDTFAKTGYLFSSIMPLGLRKAADQGLLSSGDQVMLFGGGTGMTYGATLLEWGSE